MTFRIIDNISIVNWILSKQNQKNVTRGFLWDILRNAINKTLARTQTVREELKTAEEALQKAPLPQEERVGDEYPEN